MGVAYFWPHNIMGEETSRYVSQKRSHTAMRHLIARGLSQWQRLAKSELGLGHGSINTFQMSVRYDAAGLGWRFPCDRCLSCSAAITNVKFQCNIYTSSYYLSTPRLRNRAMLNTWGLFCRICHTLPFVMLPYEAHCYEKNPNGNSYSNDVVIDVKFPSRWEPD